MYIVERAGQPYMVDASSEAEARELFESFWARHKLTGAFSYTVHRVSPHVDTQVVEITDRQATALHEATEFVESIPRQREAQRRRQIVKDSCAGRGGEGTR